MALRRQRNEHASQALDRAGRNLADAIANMGLRVTTAEFVDLAAAALRRGRRRAPADPATEIDAETRAMFEEGGFTFAPTSASDDRAVVETATQYARLLADAGTVKEVAARLGLTDGRIRQMLRARDLLAIREGDAWRVPWFQFDGARPVRGLDRVVRALPDDIHPVAAARLLTSPSQDLHIGGRAVSPLDWLRSGADPGPVIELASDL